MYKFLIFVVLSAFCGSPAFPQRINSPQNEISLTQEQTINYIHTLIQQNKTNQAKKILENLKLSNEYETERLFLLGKLAKEEGDFDTAIKYFRTILDTNPKLAKVRLELALTYMMQKSWYRADYHLRLAASEDIPEIINANIKKLLLVIRQNKNWNVWFNVGIAPDNNINNAKYGEQCINTIFGVLCNELPEPVKAVGVNVAFGGDYEFKIFDSLRLKSDFALINSSYDKSKYDDLYLSLSTGPKWVYRNGDIWTAVTATKRYLAHSQYSESLGFKIATSYDFSRNLFGNLNLYRLKNYYEDYKVLEGFTDGYSLSLTYLINSSMYIRAKQGIEREHTGEDIYSNKKYIYALGFGMELPFNFTMYLEPSLSYIDYDGAGFFVKDNSFKFIKEHDLTKKYSLSLANKKIDIYGFTPTITFSYTDRDSNVWQKEYDKLSAEFTINKRL